MDKLEKIIFYLFALLFFLVPLVMWPYTSEVFEFNKMVFVYAATILIAGAWVARMIIEKKYIFRRTILDLPLLAFIGSQTLSTLFSIDLITSIFGYYSRFNGGLLSIISYSLLYWAYVSNVKKDAVHKHLIIIIISSVIASGAAILEHFGIFLTCGMVGSITKNCWQQDVQSRVFSTFGQPNWLAAWVTAISPIGWAFLINEKIKIKNFKFWIWTAISLIFYATLLFTRSRSGLAGYIIAFIVFWGYILFKNRTNQQEKLKPFAVLSFSLLIISLIFGTPWTPTVKELITHKIVSTNNSVQGPALEVGGTESGTIRRIVWKGAVDVWLHYPIFGSGVETFAYSYYQYRPAEHNLVSEWDFIYNKAHNEYLNYAATTGTLGLLSYLVLIGFSIYQTVKIPNKYQYQINTSTKLGIGAHWYLLDIGLLAGYTSLLVSNFFGFSVVPTQLQLFLFPAFAGTLALQSSDDKDQNKKKAESWQKIAIVFILLTTGYLLLATFHYWQADLLYAKARNLEASGRPDLAISPISQAIQLEPYQVLYHNEISQTYAMIAVAANDKKDTTQTQDNLNLALSESQKALDLSPANLNIRRSRFGVFVRLSAIDPQFLISARNTLTEAIKLAPTDAKLYYNLGLTQARTGQTDEALVTFQKTIDLKPNYKEARLAYALLLISKKDYLKAKDQLEYILKNIDPNDSLTKQTLEQIK